MKRNKEYDTHLKTARKLDAQNVKCVYHGTPDDCHGAICKLRTAADWNLWRFLSGHKYKTVNVNTYGAYEIITSLTDALEDGLITSFTQAVMLLPDIKEYVGARAAMRARAAYARSVKQQLRNRISIQADLTPEQMVDAIETKDRVYLEPDFTPTDILTTTQTQSYEQRTSSY